MVNNPVLKLDPMLPVDKMIYAMEMYARERLHTDLALYMTGDLLRELSVNLIQFARMAQYISIETALKELEAGDLLEYHGYPVSRITTDAQHPYRLIVGQQSEKWMLGMRADGNVDELFYGVE